MEENKELNLVEILKDCPKGMELDCTMYEEATLIHILGDNAYPIKIETPDGQISLNKYGKYSNNKFAKCVIFPKGKTTWEGFVPPCKFKDGCWITNGYYTWQVISHDNFDYTLQNQYGEYVDDTIDYVNKAFHLWTIEDAKDGDVLFHSDSASNGIFIFMGILQLGTIQKVTCYCDYDSEDGLCLGENHTCCWTDSKILHPATKEQCDLLFRKMEKAGYEWNEETKTLEKLVEPKFKVGNKVRHKSHTRGGNIVTEIKDTHYILDDELALPFISQDDYELVTDKFEISTLKPFDKVLVRDSDGAFWDGSFYLYTDRETSSDYPYSCISSNYKICIPYNEETKHLLGTSDEAPEYYRL